MGEYGSSKPGLTPNIILKLFNLPYQIIIWEIEARAKKNRVKTRFLSKICQ